MNHWTEDGMAAIGMAAMVTEANLRDVRAGHGCACAGPGMEERLRNLERAQRILEEHREREKGHEFQEG